MIRYAKEIRVFQRISTKVVFQSDALSIAGMALEDSRLDLAGHLIKLLLLLLVVARRTAVKRASENSRTRGNCTPDGQAKA